MRQLANRARAFFNNAMNRAGRRYATRTGLGRRGGSNASGGSGGRGH